jgi:Zn-finger nucleic acid-binding protein
MIIENDIICPICSKKMTKLELGKTTIDVCLDGCGGIWFDNYEIRHFDNGSEDIGQILENIQPEEGTKYDPDAERLCPRCPNSVMIKTYYDFDETVLVDRCNICGGTLLDGGEIAKIRSLYFTAEEKKQDEDKKTIELSKKNGTYVEDRTKNYPPGFKLFMKHVVDRFM